MTWLGFNPCDHFLHARPQRKISGDGLAPTTPIHIQVKPRIQPRTRNMQHRSILPMNHYQRAYTTGARHLQMLPRRTDLPWDSPKINSFHVQFYDTIKKQDWTSPPHHPQRTKIAQHPPNPHQQNHWPTASGNSDAIRLSIDFRYLFYCDVASESFSNSNFIFILKNSNIFQYMTSNFGHFAYL